MACSPRAFFHDVITLALAQSDHIKRLLLYNQMSGYGVLCFSFPLVLVFAMDSFLKEKIIMHSLEKNQA